MEAVVTLKLSVKELDVLRVALDDSIWRHREIRQNNSGELAAAARAAEAKAADLLAKLK